MANSHSRVTIHMAASLDGFIARADGRVDRLETSDEFVGGDTMDPGFVEAFLKGISFFDRLDKDVALHLVEVKATRAGW